MANIGRVLANKVGRAIFERYQPSIVIVDDTKANFGKVLLEHAKRCGYNRIDRIHYVRSAELDQLITPGKYDVIILDIKGVVHPDIAVDGLQLSELIRRSNSAYLALTSAHQYHLDKRTLQADRIIENRIMTAVDFVKLLDEITEELLERKIKFAKKLGLRAASFLLKKSVAASS